MKINICFLKFNVFKECGKRDKAVKKCFLESLLQNNLEKRKFCNKDSLQIEIICLYFKLKKLTQLLTIMLKTEVKYFKLSNFKKLFRKIWFHQ